MADFTGLNPLLANIARVYAAQGAPVPVVQRPPQYQVSAQPITAASLNPFNMLQAPPTQVLSPAVQQTAQMARLQMPQQQSAPTPFIGTPQSPAYGWDMKPIVSNPLPGQPGGLGGMVANPFMALQPQTVPITTQTATANRPWQTQMGQQARSSTRSPWAQARMNAYGNSPSGYAGNPFAAIQRLYGMYGR